MTDPEQIPGDNPEVAETEQVRVENTEQTDTPREEPTGTTEALIPQRSRNLESRELAKAMSSVVASPTKEGIAEHLKNHPECLASMPKKDESGNDLTNEARSERLSEEILGVESKLIASFVAQVNEAYPNPDDTQKSKITQAIESVREGVYSIIINGGFSGEKIQDLIGEINFKSVQGEEVNETAAIEKNEIVAYVQEGNDGKINIFVYASFLESGGQAHVIRHEIGHALNESTNLWDKETFSLFMQCAKDPSNQEFSKLPAELAEIVRLVNNPESHSSLWSGYITPILEKLATMPEGDEKADLKVIAAREIAADMTAFYLESDGSDETFFETRMQFSKENIVPYLQKVSNTNSPEELQRFCADRGANINIQTINISELSSQLAKIPEFRPLFGLNSIFAQKMRSSLENRGEKIQKRELQPSVSHIDRYKLSSDTSRGTGSGPTGEGNGDAYSGTSGGESGWSKVWGILTGRGSGSSSKGAGSLV